jgi:hypothetical protein
VNVTLIKRKEGNKGRSRKGRKQGRKKGKNKRKGK